MYLKQLELQGFKSFPEKVRLSFRPGVTVVVGPNGSGKSNISDSVRWVLGEQRAKSLRGEKMEDVIFAGTANRKPLGFAEVSLVLDNSDQKMPIDYTEVKITRTVYRSGESRYLINGTPCRLKDIHGLFLDTGVGREGYAIIGQGRIDEILNSKGEDRRRLFEEAAGIVKFRLRREEAMEKLEKERQNLLRVEDIILELEQQLAPLEEQSRLAKEYLAYREERKTYEIAKFYHDATQIQQDMQQWGEKQAISKQHLEEAQMALSQTAASLLAFRTQQEALQQQTEAKQQSLSALLQQKEQLAGQRNLTLSQAETLEKEADRLMQEAEEAQIQAQEEEQKAEGLLARETALQMALSALQERLSAAEQSFAALCGALEESEGELESEQAAMIAAMQASTAQKGTISRLEVLLEQFEGRKAQLEKEAVYEESRRHDRYTRLRVLEKQQGEWEEKKTLAAQEEERLQGRLEESRANQQRLSGTLSDLERQFHSSQSRHKVLLEMKNEYEGFYKSVKTLLKLRQKPGFTGICGAVAEVVTVSEGLEVAMETALGNAMQNIITETEEDAKLAIDYLKRNALGRATFLPLRIINGRTISDRDRILAFDGVVGIGTELVRYEKKYTGVMQYLLGRTVVVKDMDTAIRLGRETRYQYKLVTLDGDVMNPSGVMSGGSVKKTTNLFGRTREITALEEELNRLGAQKAKVEEALQQERAKQEQQLQAVQEAQKALQQCKLQLAQLVQEASQCQEQLAEQETIRKNRQKEQETLQTQINQAQADLAEAKAQWEEKQALLERLNRKVESRQELLQSDRTKKEQAVGQMTACKVELSAKEQEKAGLEQQKKSLLDTKARLLRQAQQKREDRQRALAEQQQKQAQAEAMANDLALLEEKQQQEEAERQTLQTQMEESKTRQAQAEQQRQTNAETVHQLESDLWKMEARMERLEEEKERMYREIWETYEVTYGQAASFAKEELSVNELVQKIKSIKSAMQALGNVNVHAIEEYRTTKERYDFLTSQRDDIRQAEAQLEGVITELAERMEQQFRTQFAVMNRNFGQVFRELFGGGQAHLKMADEAHALEGGIEIIAQPPGKILQNMMLLSGGERALTAIAILFAILKMKPSPFCILDEIEAALDEVNVKRYADYLRRFSAETQFVVITHRKGTMESADLLYGVTMEEQGISKLISIDFEKRSQKEEEYGII